MCPVTLSDTLFAVLAYQMQFQFFEITSHFSRLNVVLSRNPVAQILLFVAPLGVQLKMKSLLSLIILLTLNKVALANPICSAYYGPKKAELAIIHKAFALHVERKQVSPDLTHRAILNFSKIIDPHQFLFYQNEIQQLRNLESQDLQGLHSEVFSSRERTFHQNFQQVLGERLWFLISNVTGVKEVRTEILNRIPLVKLESIPDRERPYPENQGMALNYFMDYIAQSGAKLKALSEQSGQYPLSNKEAMVMALRLVRNELTSVRYLYGLEPLPALIAKSYVDLLDSHSKLLLPKENSEFLNTLYQAEFHGLGIVGRQTFKGFEVLKVFNKSGAAKAGLQSGDIITHVKIDKTRKQDLGIPKISAEVEWTLIRNIDSTILIQEILRGKKSSTVDIRILRQGVYLEKTVQRKMVAKSDEAITLNFRETARGKIAHLKLDSFYSQSAQHLVNNLREVQNQRAEGLIFDLRGNGGGDVSEMLRILGFFIRKGPGIIYRTAKGIEEDKIIPLDLSNRDAFWTKPLIVLTDKTSASASEGLSGALKDFGRALIVGEDATTYGKGSVQQFYRLNSAISMKITIALFSSPNGSHRQFDGVTPDILIKTAEDPNFKFERDLENAIQPHREWNDSNFETLNAPMISNREEIVQRLIRFKDILEKKKIKERAASKVSQDQVPSDPVKEIAIELMAEFIALQK